MTIDPVRRESADRYAWGDGCEGWHLLRDPSLSVIEERMPPGASETLHRHAKARQFFYVLAGVLVIDLAGRSVTLSAGAGIGVPPRIPHQVRNLSDRDVFFLVVSHPPSHGDRIEGGGGVPEIAFGGPPPSRRPEEEG